MSKYFIGNLVDIQISLLDESSIYCLATSIPFTNQAEIDRIIEMVMTDQNLKNFKILDEDEETILSQAENFTFVNTINMGGGQDSSLERGRTLR